MPKAKTKKSIRAKLDVAGVPSPTADDNGLSRFKEAVKNNEEVFVTDLPERFIPKGYVPSERIRLVFGDSFTVIDGPFMEIASRQESPGEYLHELTWWTIATTQRLSALKRVQQRNPVARAFLAIDQAMPNGSTKELFERNDELIFALLNRSDARDLSSPLIRKLLEFRTRVAIEKNDANFFQKLGRALSKPAEEPRTNLSRVEDDLLAFWATPRGPDEPPLHCFTDRALTQFFREAHGSHNLTEAAVCKVRQRLGLKRIGTYIIRRVQALKRVGNEYSKASELEFHPLYRPKSTWLK